MTSNQIFCFRIVMQPALGCSETKPVSRDFEAIRVHDGGADFGIGDHKYAWRAAETGYAGSYIGAATEAEAIRGMRAAMVFFLDDMQGAREFFNEG